MKLRIVKRWFPKSLRFVFFIQRYWDDGSVPYWDDLHEYPIDTEEEARVKVTEVMLNTRQGDMEIVVAEF